MKFQHVRFATQVDARPETVFALVADPGTYPSWAGMDAGELERPGSTTPFGVGAIRRLTRGRTIGREEVVCFEEPNRFSYVMLAGVPVRDYRGDVELESVEGGTRITWRTTFRPKVPLTGALAQRTMQKFTEGLVRGLVAHLAGSSVGDDSA